MNTHGMSTVPENYLLVKVKVGGKWANALLDTGAQPSVIKLSFVPIGTEIVKKNISIKGVKGPNVTVCGTADIPFEMGQNIFWQNCVVIQDEAIDFPASSDIIFGANFIVHNQIDISTNKWALLREGSTLKFLEPSLVDGNFFSAAESDYAHNSHMVNPELESANTVHEDTPSEELTSNLDRYDSGDTPVTTSVIRKKSVKIYPEESLNSARPMTLHRKYKAHKTEDTKQSENVQENSAPEDYNVASVANISIQGKELALVEIEVTDSKGRTVPNDTLFKLKGGIINPGVILIEGITQNKNAIAIMNFNSDSLNLSMGIPFTTASKIDKEEVLNITSMSAEASFENPEIYTLMAISSITEEAVVFHEEYESEPDNLEGAFKYDPAEISPQEVIYDEARFQKLLKYMQADKWKLSNDQRRAAEKVLSNRQRAFNLPGEALPLTPLIEHDIELIDETKVAFVKPRWTPIHQRPHIEKEVKGLLNHEMAGPTMSAHSSPVVLVKKKDKGQYRLAVDYRTVNKLTVPRYFPINNIEEVVFKVAKSKVHSTVDLRQGFHQVGMNRRSQPITAFSCHLGHFMYMRMPFGLINAPHTMNALMTKVFGDVRDFVSHFFDDVFIHSETVKEHIDHLDAALSRLIDANLQASAEKTKLFTTEVSVLGHIAGNGYIKPGLDKSSAIMEFPIPTTKTNVRGFLGLTGFFRKFVRNYAFIAKPLTHLTKEDVPMVWTNDQQVAFDTLKRILLSEPILRAPDFSRTWYLLTDACDIGIGAWVAQRYDGQLHPVAFFSRQLRKGELGLKRDAMELETLALLEGLKKFRSLVWGQRIVILSDNSPLTWLFSKATYKSARLTRWALAIQGFNAEVLHLPGVLNKVSDALSRNPQPIPIEDDIEHKAKSILEACDSSNISLIGVFNKVPSQKIVTSRINSLRSNEKEVDELDIEQAWTLEEMKEKQGQDILLKPIIDYLKVPSEMNKSKIDPNIKNLQDFFIDSSDVLFIRINDKKAELRDNEEVLVIPHKLQEIAASIIHDTIIGGHAAAERTIFAAKRRFYWRHMNSTIKKYVEKCKVCQLNKGRAHPKQPLRKYPVPEKMFDVVSTDLIGPLPLTAAGNKFILVVTCFLSRYCVVKALPDKTADSVAQGLWGIFCEHGMPSVLYSDSGSEFRNNVMKEMAKNFQLQHVRVAVYHPSSNGLTERKNASVITALKCFMNLEDWDKCLPTAQLAVNSAYCSSLGDSPFYIYRSKDPELPYTRFAKPAFSYSETLNFEQERQRRENFVLEKVKEKLLESADRNCRQRAKKCKEKTLKIDDRVFIKNIQKKGQSKLIPKWQGPYRIMSQKNPGVYKLKDLRTGKVCEHHIENIKEKVIMARESEVPLEECPEARLPFPVQEEEGTLRSKKHTPEGKPNDNFVDNSFWLRVPGYDPNTLEGPMAISTADWQELEEPPEILESKTPYDLKKLRRSARLAENKGG